jgi:hypothetical protein
MATPAIDRYDRRNRGLRLDLSRVEKDSDVSVALKLILSNSSASEAVVYWFDADQLDFAAVAWHSRLATPACDLLSRLSPDDVRSLRWFRSPVQCGAGEKFFGSFPETSHCGLDRILIVPLFLNERARGFLTLERAENSEFARDQIDKVLVTARLLGVVFERDELERNLASRKMIERANGILQRNRALTEEQAYVTLRSVSRCRQCAMSEWRGTLSRRTRGGFGTGELPGPCP